MLLTNIELSTMPRPRTTPLAKSNYGTVVGYALYPIISSAFELVGISTLPSNAEVSSRYQVRPYVMLIVIGQVINYVRACMVVTVD